MKLLTAVAAIAIASFASFPVAAGEWISDSERYFTPTERSTPYAAGFGSIQGRYPHGGGLAALNIPNGAGAPVPVDPFSLPRNYSLGETAVPFTVVHDAKGRATFDAKGRAAWDGAPGRMTFGY